MPTFAHQLSASDVKVKKLHTARAPPKLIWATHPLDRRFRAPFRTHIPLISRRTYHRVPTSMLFASRLLCARYVLRCDHPSCVRPHGSLFSVSLHALPYLRLMSTWDHGGARPSCVWDGILRCFLSDEERITGNLPFQLHREWQPPLPVRFLSAIVYSVCSPVLRYINKANTALSRICDYDQVRSAG